MRLIPVIDLMGGQVVRAIAGRRSEYRPLVSSIVRSTAPFAVANALIERVQPAELYLADLDSIAGHAPCWESYQAIRASGVPLWIDPGWHVIVHQSAALAQVAEGWIIGLESAPSPQTIEAFLHANDSATRTIFSLDLRCGRMIGDLSAWETPDDRPMKVVQRVYDMGIRRIIVLDLARVGMGEGIGTESLCSAIKQSMPGMEIIAGGGVRNRDDINHLAKIGIDAVLVASAIHDGIIP